MFFLYPVLQLFFDLATRCHNEASFLFKFDVLVDVVFPLAQLFKLLFDRLQIFILLLELLKVKLLVEFVNVAAHAELLGLLFDVLEVHAHAFLDLFRHTRILGRLGHDRAEAGTRVSDQPSDVLVELVVVDHAVDFLSHSHHVLD